MKTNKPTSMRLTGGMVNVQAAKEEGGLPTFRMTAYTGGAMRLWGFYRPVVIDLSGLQAGKNLPALREHDADRIVGHHTNIEIKPSAIIAEGVFSGGNAESETIINAGKNGYPWQSSIGADNLQVERVEAGNNVTVNGKVFAGPVDVVRKARLREISFVTLGADGDTEAAIQASFYEGDAIMAEVNSEEKPAVVVPEVKAAKPAAPAVVIDEEAIRASAERHAQAAFNRMSRIRDIAAEFGDPIVKDKDGKDIKLSAKAMAENWTEEATELAARRLHRPQQSSYQGGNFAGATDRRILEAAVCQSLRAGKIEKDFTGPELEAAHKAYKGRIGLQEMLLEAARANGYEGRFFRASEHRNILRAAFSTNDIDGILSNTANKFLMAAFDAVDGVWRQVTATRAVNDFKTITGYRLTGSLQYEKVGNGGEIKHGSMAETSYTNRAETYAKMSAITRQDQINDDLGALNAIPARLGRGAGLKINDVFWTAFMDNSSFFASGNSNYFTGATTTLGYSSLDTAVQKFKKQVDEDSKPVAFQPAILLVPSELAVTAFDLVAGNETRTGDTTASTITKATTSNFFRGKYQVYDTPYLSNSSYTGYSTTAWYLLANPMDCPVIETVFLDGKEAPTIESSDADFDTLGIQMRGYHDFGVTKQEYRGGVKSKGAA